ncbi:MAG: right-handed parallel beta-helix repeat-containing protein, partial [Elusimicrobia bacterium]|nr:right-handed parallel beta-helix repeat-containing protein [Elusimicrobiota bacterium]
MRPPWDPAPVGLARTFPYARAAAVSLLLLAPALGAHAAQKTWDGGGGTGEWNTAANWDPDGIPGSTEAVTLATTAFVSVSAAGPAIAFSSLTLRSTLVLSTGVASIGALWIQAGGDFRQNSAFVLTFSSVTIASGGKLQHIGGGASRVNIRALNSFDLQAGGLIEVSSRGYWGGSGGNPGSAGSGPGLGGGRGGDANAPGAGGGGHGGAGGAGGNGTSPAGGAANDSESAPVEPGSGGGGGREVTFVTAGGFGGGAVILDVGGALNIDGVIAANGEPGFSGGGSTGDGASGGGAGGTIYLKAASLAGTGSLSARGGAGGSDPNAGNEAGGGGGGGRLRTEIAGSNSSSFTCSFGGGAAGGGNAQDGATGTDSGCRRPTSLSATDATVRTNRVFTATATLIDVGSGGSLAGKSVTFSFVGSSLAAATNALGVATVQFTAPASTGVYAYTATFAGDASYQASSDLVNSVTVVDRAASAGSGPWSATATWTGGLLPAADFPATVAAGHAVTVDVLTAVSSATQVDGTLAFSRASSSSLTLVGGHLTVSSGGTLDLGTEASPIPAGVSANLVLAAAPYPAQYGLVVNAGGNFSVRGATKAPSAAAASDALAGATSLTVPAASAAGWAAGDVIAIGPTERGYDYAEKRTLTSVAGGGTLTLSWSGGLFYNHRATAPLIVANLSRNVVLRSSGTDGNGGYTSFVLSNTSNPGGFSASYGEFRDLGGALPGLEVNATGGEPRISSCAFHNRQSDYRFELNLRQAGASLESNAAYDARVNLLAARVTAANNRLLVSDLTAWAQCAGCTLRGNDLPGSTLDVLSSEVLVASNRIFASYQGSVMIGGGANTTFLGNFVYGNVQGRVSISGSGNTVAEGAIGFDGNYGPNPNDATALGSTAGSLVLKRVRLNGLVDAAGLSAGRRLASYSQDLDTGTLRLWGDYAVSGSTFALEHGTQLYASTATAPKPMRGAGHSASVGLTYDPGAVSQYVTIRRDAAAGNWRVEGSVTGLMGTFSGSIGYTPFPSAGPHFALSFTQGGAPQDGDFVDFVVLAASNDAAARKRLLVGPAAATFNSGRSKVSVAPGGGFKLVGLSTSPSVMDRLDAAAPFYTFVDSGAFTMAYATVTNADADGLQLSGSGGVSLATSTFDFMGVAAGSSTYITLRSLASSATFFGLAFRVSRSTSGAASASNIRVESSDAGLDWTLRGLPGKLWGEAFDAELGASDRVRWVVDVPCVPVASARSGVWSDHDSWDLGFAPTACNPVTIQAGHTVTVDTPEATASTTAVSGTLAFSRVSGSTFTLAGGNLTVDSGGTLDLGTESSPIPAGVKANLILAYGAVDSQYGLLIADGGAFSVRGATKSHAATAVATAAAGAISIQVPAAGALGWSVGDTIAIGPSRQGGLTETRTITVITGADPKAIVWSGSLADSHAGGVARVANLTRNVLVRSSGTVLWGNTAFLWNQTSQASNFAAAYGEFAYLGCTGAGLYFYPGSRGSISSSTVRDSCGAVSIDGASVTLTANNITGNQARALWLQGAGTTLSGNDIFANAGGPPIQVRTNGNRIVGNRVYSNGDRIVVESDRNLLDSNEVYANAADGLHLQGARNRALSNRIFWNGLTGLAISGDENTASLDDIYENGGHGIEVSGRGNRLAAERVHANAWAGARLLGGSTNTWVGSAVYGNGGGGIVLGNGASENVFTHGSLGYDGAGASLPDSGGEVSWTGAGGGNLALRGTRVNPSGEAVSALDDPGSYLLSYGQDFDTGTLRLWGEYQVSGSTLSLDYGQALLRSTATPPVRLSGVTPTASVCSTNDADAVSQLITVERVAGVWQVRGSSSGSLGTLTPGGSCPGTGFPAGQPQFNLIVSEGASAADGDLLDFALVAGTQDQNVRKRLLFGPSAASLRGARSKLTVAAGAGLSLTGGGAAAYTLVDRLPGSSTYYTLVSSGAFAMAYASMTNADESGLQLSGSGPISLSSATFDYLGLGAGTNAYITARVLTSTAILDSVAFGVSRSTAGALSAANVRVEGSDAGLNWVFRGQSDGLWGEAYDQELGAGDKVRWVAPNCDPVLSVQSGPWSEAATWSGLLPPAACNTVTVQSGHAVTVDAAGATAGATTVNGTLSFSRVAASSLTLVGGDLIVNPGGTLDLGTEASPIPGGVEARLILASGTYSGRFGLIVNDGASFSVRGAAKTPATTALSTAGAGALGIDVSAAGAAGWAVGDLIAIGKTATSFADETEYRTLAGISGGDPKTLSWSGGLTYSHAGSVARVANLTRNVLIRSSGTVVEDAGGNSAYLYSLATNATSFYAAYGEFAHLYSGLSATAGISFFGSQTRGSISSSTFRDCRTALWLDTGVRLIGNNIGRNTGDGIRVQYSNNTIFANDIFSNGGDSVRVLGSSNVVSANHLYANAGYLQLFGPGNSATSNEIFANQMIAVLLGRNSTFSSNRVYSSGWMGVWLVNSRGSTVEDNEIRDNSRGLASNGSLDVFTSNRIHSNSAYGVTLEANSSTNTFVGNAIYANGVGLLMNTAYGNVFSRDSFGYDVSGAPRPNGTELDWQPGGAPGTLLLRQARVHPQNPVGTANLLSPESRLLSYAQDFDTGTVRLWGEHEVRDSTMTLDYGTALLASTATAPRPMSGTGATASVCSTDDANAVSQLVTVERIAGAWQVRGSSSGLLGTIAPGGSCPGTALPAGQPQFTLSLNEGAMPADGDRLDFALLAGTRDQNVRKRLLFGPSAPALRGGRSKLVVSPGAGLSLVGSAAAYGLLDRLGASDTYYTLVSSGAFTLAYASMTNADESGLQLWGAGPVSLGTATFDGAGQGASATSTYITARDLVSDTTFYRLSFGNARESGRLYNIRVQGEDAGLSWFLRNSTGALSGGAFAEDPNGRLRWTAGRDFNNGSGDGRWGTPSNWVPDGVPTASDDVAIQAGWSVYASSDGPALAFNSLTVSSATLTVSTGTAGRAFLRLAGGATLVQASTGTLRFSRVLAEPGALLTHAANASTRSAVLDLDASGDFELQAGATISVLGKGYAGGASGGSAPGLGPGGGSPSTFSGGSGGAYGGGGGRTPFETPGGRAYGGFAAPAELGSGGGGSVSGAGGAGGGSVRVEAGGSLVLD